jgi:hypothetical protein
VIATIMPISTNTMIAICIQIQVGDMAEDSVPAAISGGCPRQRRAVAGAGRPLAARGCPAQGRLRPSMLPGWLDASPGRQDALAE